MSKYGKLGKNIAFITIGNFASKILSFLMVPFYTAYLSTQEFGISDLMTTTINLIMPFFTILLSESLLRFALDKNYDRKTVFTTGLVVASIGTLAFLCFSPLALLYDKLGEYYVLFVGYYIVVAFHNIFAYFTRGIDKVFVYSLSGVVQTLVFLGFNIVLIGVLKTGVRGYLLSMIIGTVVSIIILFLGAKLYKYISLSSFSKSVLREMVGYSMPMIPNSISWWVSNSSDKYILTIFSGLSITGIYSMSQRIPSVFAVVSTIFMGAWQISAVEDFGSDESRKFFSDVYKCYSTFNIISVSLLICLT